MGCPLDGSHKPSRFGERGWFQNTKETLGHFCYEERRWQRLYIEVVEILLLSPLKICLTKMSHVEGNQNALWRTRFQWDGLSEKLGQILGSQVSDWSSNKGWWCGPVRGMQPLHTYELGNKSWLYTASWIGKDERLDQAKTLVWDTLNLLQDDADQGKEEMRVACKELDKILSSLEKQKSSFDGEFFWSAGQSLYKKLMVAINSRIIPMEVWRWPSCQTKTVIWTMSSIYDCPPSTIMYY